MFAVMRELVRQKYFAASTRNTLAPSITTATMESEMHIPVEAVLGQRFITSVMREQCCRLPYHRKHQSFEVRLKVPPRKSASRSASSAADRRTQSGSLTNGSSTTSIRLLLI